MSNRKQTLDPLTVAEIAAETQHDRRTVRNVAAGKSPEHLASTERIKDAIARRAEVPELCSADRAFLKGEGDELLGSVLRRRDFLLGFLYAAVAVRDPKLILTARKALRSLKIQDPDGR